MLETGCTRQRREAVVLNEVTAWPPFRAKDLIHLNVVEVCPDEILHFVQDDSLYF